MRRPVRPLRRFPAIFAALGILAASFEAHPQSLLLGPAARRVKATVELDPHLPTGSLRRDSLAIAPEGKRACSPTLPLCVVSADASESVLEASLSALEAAYRRLVYAARLPVPVQHSEPGLGALAVTWELTGGPASLEVQLRPTSLTVFESAAVVCRSGAADALVRSIERNAFLCIGEAIAARLDAAESPRSRRAFAQALWWELGQPTEADLVEIARANAHPESAAVGRDELADSASTALFFEYLERSLGTNVPFGLITGLFALSVQPRRFDTPRYPNEPDWLDVLRASLGDDNAGFAHRVNAFGAARAQLGIAEGPLASLAWAGDFARLVPDWDLRVSSLPRRVASRNPVLPLGLVAVRIDIDVPTRDLGLGVRVEWEAPVPFTWTAVKFDAENRESGRIDLAFEPRVTSAEKHIVALDGTRSLLILGTNLGGIDATHLLDPDHAPFEPHGCTVYVVRI